MPIPLRIFVADDHTLYREGLKAVLQKLKGFSIAICGDVSDGTALLEHLPHSGADVLFTDIQMPGRDGVETTRYLHQSYPGLPIIALSFFLEVSVITDMIQAGAQGYLPKNAGKEDLQDALETVLRKEVYLHRSVVALLTHPPPRPVPPAVLSHREMEVLQLICQGFSNREISELLGLSIRTIESYREHLMKKTAAKNAASLIAYAIRYRFHKIED